MKDLVDDTVLDEAVHEFFEKSRYIKLAKDCSGNNGQILSADTGMEIIEIFYELSEQRAALTAVRKYKNEVIVKSIEFDSTKLGDIVHQSIQLASELHKGGDDTDEQ
jgi:hypothetical protein